MSRLARGPAGGRLNRARSGGSNLALLYQEFLTAIVKIQAKREQLTDCESFRRSMKDNLQKLEEQAGGRSASQDLQDAKLAVVAFLDEVILGTDNPCKAQWMRRPLAHDLLGQPVAGEAFFDRLDALLASRNDSASLADVLEVFVSCLLLGFEGKYSGGRKAELKTVIDRTRSRIDAIRGRASGRLAPEGGLPEEPRPVRVTVRRKNGLVVALLVSAVAVIVLFIAFKLHLLAEGSDITRILAGR